MNKLELIKAARRMMKEAYDETDRGGFDEWDQHFIETLTNDLLPHLSIEGLKILIKGIEESSTTGINRRGKT